MQCFRCGHELAGISGSKCPGCGTAVRHRGFAARRYSRVGRCPLCLTRHEGIDEKGYKERWVFQCSGCETWISVNWMSPGLSSWSREKRALGLLNPWLKRLEGDSTRTLFGAWFGTIRMGITQPRLLMQGTPRNASTRSAVGFCALTSVVYGVLGPGSLLLLVLAISMGFVKSHGPRNVTPALAAELLLGWAAMVFAMVAAVPVWAFLAHAILRLTGEVAGDYKRSLSCVCYTSGANALSAIPFLSCMLGPLPYLWWAWCAARALTSGQIVPMWRAVVASVLPVAIVNAITGVILVPAFM